MTDLSALPKCAATCFFTEVAVSTCGPSDINCVCSNDVLFNSIVTCVEAACSVKEVLTTQNLTYTLCGFPSYDKSAGFLLITIIGASVAALAVLCRIAARIRLGSMGWDDWTIIAAMALLVVLSAVMHPLYTHGIGKDVWNLAFDQIEGLLRWFYTAELLYYVTAGVIKISLLLFYLRIFTPGPLRIPIWTVITFIAVYTTIFFFAQVFVCRPVHLVWTNWDKTEDDVGTCSNQTALIYAHASVSILVNGVIFFMPIKTVMGLKMNWKRKGGIMSMFALGIVDTVISVLRLNAFVRLDMKNMSQSFAPMANWSLIELQLGIICACMPGIRALLLNIWPRIFSSLLGSTGGGNSSAHGAATLVRTGAAASVSGTRNGTNVVTGKAGVTSSMSHGRKKIGFEELNDRIDLDQVIRGGRSRERDSGDDSEVSLNTKGREPGDWWEVEEDLERRGEC